MCIPELFTTQSQIFCEFVISHYASVISTHWDHEVMASTIVSQFARHYFHTGRLHWNWLCPCMKRAVWLHEHHQCRFVKIVPWTSFFSPFANFVALKRHPTVLCSAEHKHAITDKLLDSTVEERTKQNPINIYYVTKDHIATHTVLLKWLYSFSLVVQLF